MSDPEALMAVDPRASDAIRLIRRNAAKAADLRLRVGDNWVPIRAADDTGFELDIAFASKLRGRVEIHDAKGLVRTGLVVAAAPCDDGMRYEFKRTSRALSAPPLDYVTAEPWDASSSG